MTTSQQQQQLQQPSIPSATYRFQFNKNWTFNQARELVPYLASLGISHVYASPYFKASPESTHGYDIANHNELNPVIGSRAEYDAFVAALHEHGMGQIVDFVPNHMGIAESLNEWWMDVLENGPSSVYAPFFDIDWHPLKEELENKVLLPILGDQYGRVLEKGELKLGFDNGAFFFNYFATRLPLTPRSYGLILKRTLEHTHYMGADDCCLELQSIVTATEHLPTRTETEPEKIAERAREKEIIKRRLERLCVDCPQIEEAVHQAVLELNGHPGDRHSFDELDELIHAQPYRLSFWRVASEEINYRRFFDINTLAAIRMELPEVFDAAHRLVFELIQSGAVTGLRIDHVDGLWNPREYLEKLQQRAAEFFPQSAAPNQCSLYLLVEKILAPNEKLRPDWPIHGTTGYDFTNQIIQVLVDREAEKEITETYERFTGDASRFADIVYQKKKLTMQLSLASEVNVLGHMLNGLSEKNRWYRDFTLNALTTAVREVIACFPVYRTYLEPGHETSDDDRQVIGRAVSTAKRRNPGMESSVFDFLREILLMKFPENIGDAEREEHMRFVMKFQQCTGPITAKGLEDTAFYIYNRLVALNEVGGEPQHFGATPELFHKQNAVRQSDFPHAMLATSTHDTKRSEDVRARIAAISEIPVLWRRSLQRWHTITRKHKRQIEGEFAPDANEEYLLYQALLGSWPLHPRSREEHETYIARIQDFMTKAIKEAKVNSSWIQPNEAWDTAVREFIAEILKYSKRSRFLKTFEPVAEQIAQLGAVNALSQTLLKLTLPGVPDIYQGNETWDFSLVDPDNRRPVDYEARKNALVSLGDTSSPSELLQNWRDGRIKLFLTQKLLRFRRENFDLFAKGDYTPLPATGIFKESCFAFVRKFENRTLIVIAPRLTAKIGFPPIGDVWQDTALDLPDVKGKLRDIFTGRAWNNPLAEILRELPFAAFAN
jgi:(1->4)-alpha-D-glucan 1-alpha-D-glucosylmutase